MNRREFLKVLGVAALASQIPEFFDYGSYPHFDPKKSYGDYVYVKDRLSRPIVKECVVLLQDKLNKTIPPMYRHRVKWLVFDHKPSPTSDPFEMSSVAWRYD